MYEENYNNTYATTKNDIRSFLGYPEDYPIHKIVNDIIAYLRKSRKDTELYSNESVEETLARHKKTIQEWAYATFGTYIPDENIKEEVVSGETISGRPVLQEVLKLIENDKYRAVVCVDVQRLGRGDLEDQGRIIKHFRFSNTKVLTPNQFFDLNNNYDRKFFENKMRESKEYLDYTKDILSAGRLRSVLDGNYPHSIAPYGFNRVKLQKQKGYTLEFNEDEYKVCRLAYEILVNGLDFEYEVEENDTWYEIAKKFGIYASDLKKLNSNKTLDVGNKIRISKISPGAGVIANYFNYLNIPTRKQEIWVPASVLKILTSLACHGYVSWNMHKTKVILKNGEFIKTRPLNKENAIIVRGKWKPIFNESESKKIKEIISKRSHKVPDDFELKNPLAGILVCELCNHNMQRNSVSKTIKKKISHPIDKEKLKLFLRNLKGETSLNEISRSTKISKNIINNLFSTSDNKFRVPKKDEWIKLKQFFNVEKTEFDDTILNEEYEYITKDDTLLCVRKGCKNVGSTLKLVEEHLINSLNELLNKYTLYVDNYSKNVKKEEQATLLSLELVDKEIEKTNKKITKLCEFLEDGTYSKDLFNERKYKLDIELKKLNDRKRKLSSNDRTKKYHKIKSMIPLIENVLKRYNNNITVEEKNELLGSIIEKVLYKKDKAGDDFSLKIFLKF